MKFTCYSLLVATWLIISPGIAISDEGPYTLTLGSWVCHSPEIYHETQQQLQQGGSSPFKLGKKLFDEGKCIYIDDEALEDMMQPFVSIVDQRDGLTKVNFFIEFFKRFSVTRNRIQLIKFTGWTDDENVKKHIKAD